MKNKFIVLLCFVLSILSYGQAGHRIRATVGFTNSLASSGGGGGSATFSDNFNRANEDPLSGGGNWATGLGSHQSARVVGNQVIGQSGNWVARVTTSAATFTSTHYASTVIVSGSENFTGPVVLCDASGNGYAAAYAGGSACRIYKFTTGGSFTQVGTDISGSFAAGDIIKLAANGGGVLELFKNGSSIGSKTDGSSPYTTGQPGIWGGDSLAVDTFTSADL